MMDSTNTAMDLATSPEAALECATSWSNQPNCARGGTVALMGSLSLSNSNSNSGTDIVPATLTSINLDVLHLIAKYLTKTDICNLARSCRTLHIDLSSFFYSSYTIEVPLFTTPLNDYTEISGLRDSRSPFKPAHFKQLTIRIPRTSRLRCCCARGRAMSPEDRREIQTVYEEIRSLLRAMPPNILKSFTWDMGSNRNVVRSPLHEIYRHRSSLESLTVYHFGEYANYPIDEGIPTLPQFKNLQHLSYNGIFSDYHLYTLKAFIYHHGQKLKRLQLHFDYREVTRVPERQFIGDLPISLYPSSGRARLPFVDFSKDILQITPSIAPKRLISLQELSLCYATLRRGGQEMVEAFNMANLRSLKFIECMGALDLLSLLTSTGVQIKMKRFELKHTEFWLYREPQRSAAFIGASVGVRPVDQVANFLKSFSGLEAVYIQLKVPKELQAGRHCPIPPSLLGHLATLKSLYIHGLEENAFPFRTDTYHKLYTSPQLVYKGLSTSLILYRLRHADFRPHWKVVHFRTPNIKRQYLHEKPCPGGFDNSYWLDEEAGTGAFGSHEFAYYPLFFVENRDIQRFVRWAFGEDGIPSLKVFAVGDFSYNGRFAKENLLVCRADDSIGGYRLLEKKDVELWELVEDSLDLLAACPREMI
ncbi:hypothetical protein HYFRA_00013675 [Hymenoscyphus fraxineus]|uniref:F-box domain-containing protein n=1 Tax=Hymenoscyphus fraxineus TaxID=746836 RepID=A0A9N9LCU5_9HELO|nr:hypothetical protein HYFRA_00013675 [Hymenoscyphus fraxineus]